MDVLAERLQKAAFACCQDQGNQSQVDDFVEVMKTPLRESSEIRGKEHCESLLKQVIVLLDPAASSGKALLERVGSEMPQVLVMFVGVSETCRERCTHILEILVESCSPLEMFTVIMEAMHLCSEIETIQHCQLLLHGLIMIFPRIKRQPAKFFREVIPALLALGRTVVDYLVEVCSNEESLSDLYSRLIVPGKNQEYAVETYVINELIHFGQVISSLPQARQGVHMKLLRGMLGKYSLHLMAIVTGNLPKSEIEVPGVVAQLLDLLDFCDFSLSALLLGAHLKLSDLDEQILENELEARQGAALAVFWGLHRRQVASSEPRAVPKDMLQVASSLGMLDALCLAGALLVPAASDNYFSRLEKGLSLILSILGLGSSSTTSDIMQQYDWHTFSIRILPVLQVLQLVVVYTPNPRLRRQAYAALVKICEQALPTEARFETLHTLISTCGCSSLVSLLLTCVKDEIAKAWPVILSQQRTSQDSDMANEYCQQVHDLSAKRNNGCTISPFASPRVLQMIDCVIWPDRDRFVDLPANVDAVGGALNLYRFLLIRETSGNSNYSGVLSRDELERGRLRWLLPLHKSVAEWTLEMEATHPISEEDILLGLDCLKCVLSRCLELVDAALAHLSK